MVGARDHLTQDPVGSLCQLHRYIAIMNRFLLKAIATYLNCGRYDFSLVTAFIDSWQMSCLHSLDDGFIH
jgi:hypothetical protein